MAASPHPETGPTTVRASPRELLSYLDALGIRTETREHEAVFTVAQSSLIKGSIPGAHSKNLFLKDKRGRLFLVVTKDDAVIDLKRLHIVLGASGRLSFGSPELLGARLGVQPGSVTPFAALNDQEARVEVVLDRELMRHRLLNFHPLENTMTTSIAAGDLIAFLHATGHPPSILTLPAPVTGNCMASTNTPF